jgi:hypothetical protein
MLAKNTGEDDDLRAGLRARLERLSAKFERAEDIKRQKIKAADDEFRLEVHDLEQERDLVTQLLNIEERRHGASNGFATGKPTLPLGEFLVRAAAATGPKNKEEFRTMAEQAGYEIDGRSVHAAATNGVRTGRLDIRADGRFAAVPDKTPAAKPSGQVPFALGDDV